MSAIQLGHTLYSKTELFTFWNNFSNNSQCPYFQDFYDVLHLDRSILYFHVDYLNQCLLGLLQTSLASYYRQKCPNFKHLILLCKLNVDILR